MQEVSPAGGVACDAVTAGVGRDFARVDRLSWCILSLGLFLTAAVAIVHRYTMNPDALSYLEVGEAWLRGDFATAINGYWNPLYSILTAIASKLGGSRLHEPIGPHILTIFLYVGAVAAFLKFMRAVLTSGVANEDYESWGVLLSGASALFVFSAVYMIDPAYCVPDLLVMIWVLLAAAAGLSMREEGARAAALFGAFLALGYLTKPVMFPLGLIFLTASLVPAAPAKQNAGRVLSHTAIASAVFLAICALYILPLSLQKGRFTFSDSGSLAYAWEVDGFSPYFHWQGQPAGSGTPLHSTRQILEDPPTFEFDGPRPGTYSPWVDPSYWNAGLKAPVKPREQLRRLAASTRFYGGLLRGPVAIVFLFSIAIAATAIGWRRFARSLAPRLDLLLPCAAAFILYALVFAIARYFAPFVVISGALLLALCWREAEIRRAGPAWSRVFALVTVLFVSLFSAQSIARELKHPNARSYRVHRPVADELRHLGIQSGDKVAVIGAGCESYFARLAGVRIVAETLVFPGHPDWPATSENILKIVRAFAQKTEAKAVISSVAPLDEDPAWIPVSGSPYRILVLNRD